MPVFTDGGNIPAPSFDPDAALKAAATGGPTLSGASGPLIPVKHPGVAYKPAGAGSVNALEHGLADPSGRTTLMDPETAANAIYAWDAAAQKDFAKHAWYLGGLASPDDLSGAWQLWQQAVKVAAGFSAAGNPMDPRDVLDMMLTGDPNAAKARAQRKTSGVVTQKANSINVASPSEARLLIEQAYKARMGREPTDAEVRTLTASLQEAQRKNPSTTTTTAKYDAAGNMVSQDSSTSGGLDPQGFVDQQFDNNPDAAEHQAAATYFPLLMSSLASPVGR